MLPRAIFCFYIDLRFLLPNFLLVDIKTAIRFVSIALESFLYFQALEHISRLAGEVSRRASPGSSSRQAPPPQRRPQKAGRAPPLFRRYFYSAYLVSIL